MEKPSFKRSTAARLDERLEEFFIRGLGYSPPIKSDPNERPRDSHRWRMVFPLPDSRPFAVSYQSNLSAMKRQEVTRLYVDRIVPHRDGRPTEPAPILYILTDGARFIFFSAAAAHGRDERFDLSAETWQFAEVRRRVEALRASAEVTPLASSPAEVRCGNLIFRRSDGRLTPQVEFLFASSRHAANECFRRYAREVRRQLVQAVAANEDALAAVIYHLLESPAAAPAGRPAIIYADNSAAAGDKGYRLRRMLRQWHPVLKLRLGEAIAAAVDTLLLSKMTTRLHEAFYPFSPAEDRCGPNAHRDKPEVAQLPTRSPIAAARAIEAALLARQGAHDSWLLRDFLDPSGEPADAAGATRRQFRYQDLKPQSLQDYYEETLSTAVSLDYDAEAGELRAQVSASGGRRRELAAYYTNERLCRFMVERTIKPLFDRRLKQLGIAAERGTIAEARACFESVMGFSVCDPTMGSAPFLRSAFAFLAEPVQYLQLRRHVATLKRRFPSLYRAIVAEYQFLRVSGEPQDRSGIDGWERHVLRCMLYGVDIDPKANGVACQTLALSALHHLKQSEPALAYFSFNLKLGNALISPTRLADRAQLAIEHRGEIAELIRLRQRARRLPNAKESAAEAAELLCATERVRLPLTEKLISERLSPVLGELTAELRPFCWELEFPEVFFNADGTLKAAAGFDVIIGNPPWSNIKPDDREFFAAIAPEFCGLKRRASRDCLAAELLQEKGVKESYRHYLSVYARWNAFIRSGGMYQRQRPTFTRLNVYKIDHNFYKLALERAWELSHAASAIGLLTPHGFAGDLGASALRQLYFEGAACKGLWGFDEGARVFAAAQAFLCLLFERGESRPDFHYATSLASIEALLQTGEGKSRPIVSLDLLRRTAPETYAVPALASSADGRILRKLYQHPPLFELSPQAPWAARPARDLDTTDNRGLFCAYETGVPLLKGEDIEQYAIRGPRSLWVDEKEYRGRDKHSHASRVAWRAISNVNLRRRMHVTLVPENYALLNSIRYLIPEHDEATKLYLVGLLNSFVLEYRVRQLSRNNNINQFVVSSLPVPRLQRGDADFDCIVGLAENLLHSRGRDSLSRAELDARVARLYNLTNAELRVVLSRCPKVDAAEKKAVLAAFARLTD